MSINCARTIYEFAYLQNINLPAAMYIDDFNVILALNATAITILEEVTYPEENTTDDYKYYNIVLANKDALVKDLEANLSTTVLDVNIVDPVDGTKYEEGKVIYIA